MMTTKSKKATIESSAVIDDLGGTDLESLETTMTMLEDDMTIPELDDASVFKAEEKTELSDFEVIEEDTPLPIKGGVSMTGFSDVASLITDIDENVENLTWLVYGKNGTGKTTILSTTDGMLILAVDEGTLAIRDKAKDSAKKIKIDTWDKIESIYWLLKRGDWKDGGVYIPTASGKPFLVKSLGFDTITKLAQVCLRYVVLGEKAKDTSKDVMKPTQNDWGKMSQRMQYWLSLYKEFPLQKVWLLQESTSNENTEDEDFSVFPDVNKSLRNFVQSEADVIGRMFIQRTPEGKAQFVMLVGAHSRYITKDRTNKLPYAIANPRLDKMYNRVFGE